MIVTRLDLHANYAIRDHKRSGNEKDEPLCTLVWDPRNPTLKSIPTKLSRSDFLCDLISKPTMPSGTTSKAAIKRKDPCAP